MNTNTRTAITTAVSLVTVALTIAQADRPVIKETGKSAVYVDAVQYRPFSDEYIVTQGRAVLRIPARNVEYARSVKPAGLDNAIRTRNVAALELVLKQEHGLGWDLIALRHLVAIHATEHRSDRTVAMFELLRQRSPKIPTDTYRHYLAALRNSGQLTKLDRELDACIATGSRDLAALANIMRGDMHLKEGQVRRALVDGYLRTAVLFRDVTSQRREALEKTVAALERLHDRRAEKFRRQLQKEFPNSAT